MNSKNRKTSDPHRLILNLTDKINFKKSNKYDVLTNLNIYYTSKYMEKRYKNNKSKISAPIWNHKFELPDESNSVSDIQH